MHRSFESGGNNNTGYKNTAGQYQTFATGKVEKAFDQIQNGDKITQGLLNDIGGIPSKLPSDIRELTHNMRTIDDIRSKLDKYYDALNDQMESVAQVLSETQLTRGQTARALKDQLQGQAGLADSAGRFGNQVL